ncbi:MAG: DUF2004 domain-containing protein [Priestia megaterium]
MELCAEESDIALMIDGEFSEKQYTSYNSLLQNWGHLQQRVLQSILGYYERKRHGLVYKASFNENYPLIETVDRLLERIRLVGMYVPSAGHFEGRYIGLTFDCTWDIENGLGLRLLDEQVNDVGWHDVTIYINCFLSDNNL